MRVRLRSITPRIIALFLGCAAAPSQSPDPKFTAHSNLVFLPTRVQAKNGDTIYGLTADQFVVEDDGVRRKVHLDQDPETEGLSLVVLVQCSRSASDQLQKMTGLGTMIEAIVGGAPHEVAVIAFGRDPYILGDFSKRNVDTQIALTKLRDCSSRFNASIDTVHFALGFLNTRKTQYRRAILLIGETRDHGSKTNMQDVVAELGTTDTVIYTVAFAAARDEFLAGFKNPSDKPKPKKPPPLEDSVEGMQDYERPPLFNWPPEILLAANALKKNAAAEIASLSGGEAITFSSPKSFDATLGGIANRIHNYYLLSFEAPATDKPSQHKLRVRVPDYPGAVIQTRRSYYSAAAP